MSDPLQPPIRILVTGERTFRDLPKETLVQGKTRSLKWLSLPVLKFVPLSPPKDLTRLICHSPYTCLIFSSRRAVEHWANWCLSQTLSLPFPFTKILCAMGRKTAENFDSFPIFPRDKSILFPEQIGREPGTEGLLARLEVEISRWEEPKRALLIGAKEGRTELIPLLNSRGVEVDKLDIYQTEPLSQDEMIHNFQKLHTPFLEWGVVTSPASGKSLFSHLEVRRFKNIAAMGPYTSSYLTKGNIPHEMVPGGEIKRLTELFS